MTDPRPRTPGAPTALILVFGPVTYDSRIFREAATLRDLGFDVSIVGVVSADEQEAEVRINGFRVIRLTPVESLRRLLRRRAEFRPDAAQGGESAAGAPSVERNGPRAALRRIAIASAYHVQGAALVRRMSPELVHANDYNTMWIGIAAKLLCGSRLVYDTHELWPDQGRPEWRKWLVACEWLFLRLADATVAANPGISETIAKRYRVTPPVVVRNVAERTVRSPARPEGLRAGREPLAVHVGSVAPERGIEQAILALPRVPGLRLRLIGRASHDYGAHLDRVAAEAGVADRIEFEAPVEPTAVAETIAGADLGLALTQPTCLNNVLSLPNKLFEYTAAGLPVIASDLPVLGALIRDECLGEAVPPTDVEAIARAMRDLAEPDRNSEARKRVRSFAERVTWERERQVLESVYAGNAEVRPLTICAVGAGSSTHVASRLRWFAERGHRVFLLTASPSLAGIPGVTEVDLTAAPLVSGEEWVLGVARRVRNRLSRSAGGSQKGEGTTDTAPAGAEARPSRRLLDGIHRAVTALDFLYALSRCNPDVVHVHYAYGGHAWLAGLFGCRPLVVTVMGGDVLFEEQGSPSAAGKWMTVRLLRRSDYITTQSDFLTAAVNRLGDFGCKTERVLWGVSLDRFRRRDASRLRLALGLKPEARVLLSAKILQPFYRIHLVVEAMAIVRRSCPDAVLVVTEYLADPAYREQLLHRAAELELGDRVVFTGALTDDEMPELYSLAAVSIAVPPSDGMPQALLESLACETPQILSRLSRYEELVQHEQSAYFVDPTPESIAAGIVHLLEDEALRSRIAQEGRRIVEEQANVDEQAGYVESRMLELAATTRPRTFSLATLLSCAAAYAGSHRSA